MTDAAIDKIARSYVFGRYHSRLVPVRQFDLRDPDGVFFALADPHAKRPELAAGALGDAGFFVHRRDGTIRQFDPGDFAPAYKRPLADAADQRLVAAVTEAIQRLP